MAVYISSSTSSPPSLEKVCESFRETEACVTNNAKMKSNEEKKLISFPILFNSNVLSSPND